MEAMVLESRFVVVHITFSQELRSIVTRQRFLAWLANRFTVRWVFRHLFYDLFLMMRVQGVLPVPEVARTGYPLIKRHRNTTASRGSIYVYCLLRSLPILFESFNYYIPGDEPRSRRVSPPQRVLLSSILTFYASYTGYAH
jgi:hypothetical protein